MGKIILSVAYLFYSLSVYSQDCPANKLNSFHGITFGKPIPPQIQVVSNVVSLVGDSMYQIQKDSIILNGMYQGKMGDYFWFGDSFSTVTIFINKKSQVYCIVLSKDITAEDKAVMRQNDLPTFYKNVAIELQSILGSNFDKIKTSDLLSKIIYKQLWDCDKIKVEFEFRLDGDSEYQLLITDKKLEQEDKIYKYTH